MARAAHPKKEVEDALKHAEDNGWRVEVGGSHAKALMRVVDNCTTHKQLKDDSEKD